MSPTATRRTDVETAATTCMRASELLLLQHRQVPSPYAKPLIDLLEITAQEVEERGRVPIGATAAAAVIALAEQILQEV